MTWREDTWFTDRVSRVDLPMVVLGVAMVAAALLVPGKQAAVVAALIVMGASTAAAGVAVNRFRQIEVGPGGLKLSRDADDVVPEPWLAAEGKVLNRIAVRVLGDRDLAREAVEKALTRVRRHRGDIPRPQLDIATHKTLIAELHRRDRNRSWPGASTPHGDDDRIATLQPLPFPVRVAFAFSLEFLDSDLATILGRPEEEIRRDVEAAEAALPRHLLDAGGDGDA